MEAGHGRILTKKKVKESKEVKEVKEVKEARQRAFGGIVEVGIHFRRF